MLINYCKETDMVNTKSVKKDFVIYSVVTGGYDKILPVNIVDELCDYYIISNEKIDLPYPWKLLLPDNRGLGNKDFNRFYKINPHLIFPDYTKSLYIDGNIALHNKLYEWGSKHLDETGLAIYSHPERDNIFDEGRICSYIGTDYFWLIKRQLKNYKSQGFNANGLFEANILLRKHNDAKVIDLMSIWWAEYINSKNAKRDQLALPYVLWRADYPVKILGQSDARFEHLYFEYMPHVSNRHSTFSTKIKKIINRTLGRF